jgi:predicted DNA-binding transcriptional regulator YafY
VSFGYVDVKGTTTERSIDPLGIVFLQDKHCVLGWCHLRDDNRTFRLDRMRDLIITENSFRPRRIPMLKEALAQIRAEVADRKSRDQQDSAT